MAISESFTHCPDIKLYDLLHYGFSEVDLVMLKPGLSVEVYLYNSLKTDFYGGTQEYIGDEMIWLDIVAVEGELITGVTTDDRGILGAGSYLRFRKEHISRVRGDLAWNINNLLVMASEKIVYGREKTGYFYGFIEEKPLSFGRNFYSVSEIHAPKDELKMVLIPLSYLVAYEPDLEKYLELPAMDGVIRTYDNTFEPYLVEPRNTSVYPRGYIADWEEAENDILEDDSELPF